MSDGGKELISSQYQPSTRKFNIKVESFYNLTETLSSCCDFITCIGFDSDLEYNATGGDGKHKLDSHL